MVDVEDLPYKNGGFIWICRIYIIYQKKHVDVLMTKL